MNNKYGIFNNFLDRLAPATKFVIYVQKERSLQSSSKLKSFPRRRLFVQRKYQIIWEKSWNLLTTKHGGGSRPEQGHWG